MNLAKASNPDAPDKKADPAPERTIFDLFIQHRDNISDKWEQYLAIYESEMARFRDSGRPVHLLEIGVQNGGSLQIWKKYLPPESSIVGVDVDPACKDLPLGSGIRVEIADAGNPQELDAALGDARFDIIVDDGSHRSDDILSTLRGCFDRLQAGGLYVVEDLHTSYFASHGGGFRHKTSAIEYLKNLVDALHSDHIVSVADETAETDLDWLRQIGTKVARITFYDSIVVIQRLPEDKQRPYRRILTGQVAPVLDPPSYIANFPIGQLRDLLLSPAAASAFTPALLEAVASAREDVGRLTAELNHTTSNLSAQAEARIHALQIETGATIKDLTARCAEADTRAAKAEAQAFEAESRAAKAAQEADTHADAQKRELARLSALLAEQATEKAHLAHALAEQTAGAAAIASELAGLRSSTFWQLTFPARQIVGKLPPPIRRRGRLLAQAGWWTVTGQLSQRLRTTRRPPTLPSPSSPTGDAVPVSSELEDTYKKFFRAQAPDEVILRLQRRIAAGFVEKPLFSIVTPLFRTPLDVFEALVASVRSQSYENWELCLVLVDTGDDASQLLRAIQSLDDPRIHLVTLDRNLGISGNTNAGLEIAKGEWVVLLDHDDLLRPDALFHFVRALSNAPDAVLLYSDKDWIDRTGERHLSPLLKPQWSPEIMLAANYLTHLCAIRTDRLREIGGWRPKTDGAQDWDVFLRSITPGGAVVHVPQVLYHWRQIETSVSVGGLDAKPYAADGQLRTLEDYLPIAGWHDAHARHEGHYIRILWDASRRPSVTLVVVGDNAATHHHHENVAEVLTATGRNLEDSVNSAVGRASGEVILLVDREFTPLTPDWVDEMVLPLANDAIAVVGGQVLDQAGHILDGGVFFQNGRPYPAFRGESPGYFGPGGGAGWYRNHAAVAGGALAFRRSTWEKLGGFPAGTGRADLAFTLRAFGCGIGRLMINPFARFRAAGHPQAFEQAAGWSLMCTEGAAAILDQDPYLNPNLDAATFTGAPRLRLDPSPGMHGHDFAAEARHVGSSYDASAAEILASRQACMAAQATTLKRVLWVLPQFEVPHYGGIHTILRTAEHMRRRHGVANVFAVMGGSDPDLILSRIARAYPGLASATEVAIFHSSDSPPDVGAFDAAVCTLWTTAYALLRVRDVSKKFYFLQDWEPLFYPAGTISSAVEATYRFGFHAICNTSSLLDSYTRLGGNGDFFLPAVDPQVFHARGRSRRAAGDPFLLFFYGRPGAVRNCFEVLSQAAIELKRRHGRNIEIVSAGGAWNPQDYGLDGVVRNLGVLPYTQTGELYRAVDAGLVAMATQHPSYLPFEFMACGAGVVTNRNAHTGWLLRDGENAILCEITRSDIADSVTRLIEDPALLATITENGKSEIVARYNDWEASCERIWSIMSRVVEGRD